MTVMQFDGQRGWYNPGRSSDTPASSWGRNVRPAVSSSPVPLTEESRDALLERARKGDRAAADELRSRGPTGEPLSVQAAFMERHGRPLTARGW